MRYQKIDGIRGITIISMIAYHACWDFIYLAGMDFDRGIVAPGGPWQLSICIAFIFISGFCAGLSQSSVRRGITVFICGALVTFVTVLFFPDERIVFGVLTFLGSAMIITGLLRKYLDRAAPEVGFLSSMVLYFVSYPLRYGYVGGIGFKLVIWPGLYRGLISTYLGFMEKDFFSTDYFPLIPWLFLFAAGYYTLGIVRKKDWGSYLKKGYLPHVEWLGRHSLVIYLVHQPVIYIIIILLRGGS